MGHAEELLLVTEGDDALPVFKPDRARGLSRDAVRLIGYMKLRLRLACAVS
jgi:hypothetical protein